MFVPRQGFTNPFLQFAGNPYQVPSMFQGIQGVPPGSGFGLISPLMVNPYTGLNAAGFTAVNPLLASQIGFGQVPTINPVGFAATYPTLNPYQSFQQGYGGSGFGQGFQVPPLTASSGQWEAHHINPLAGVGNPTQSSNPFVALGAQAFPGVTNQELWGNQTSIGPSIGDPFTGQMQLTPGFYQQLPVRPLITPQHFSSGQPGLPIGAHSGLPIDPYSALLQAQFLQAQLISQLAANPFQQAVRGYSGAPWLTGGVPTISQAFPYAQGGTAGF